MTHRTVWLFNAMRFNAKVNSIDVKLNIINTKKSSNIYQRQVYSDYDLIVEKNQFHVLLTIYSKIVLTISSSQIVSFEDHI